MPIDPQFVDVHFPDDPAFTFGDLGVSAFGPPKALYSDQVQVIPESQWKELAAALAANGGGASQMVTRIYDQGQEGSCVANACSQAHEINQARQFGLDKVTHLSAMSLYQRIGSGPNSGAMVSDGLDEMASRGVLPLDTPENRALFGSQVMPNTGWRNRKPDGWETTAKNFAAHEWFIVESVNELITALLNQDPVVVGRAGHSICYCDPVYDGGNLLVKYANSWGNWGEKGFGYDSTRLIRSSASWAFALRSVSTPTHLLPVSP